MLSLFVSAVWIASTPTVAHTTFDRPVPQAASGRSARPERAADPAPQTGPAMCERIGAGGEFEHVALDDYAEWLTEQAPTPKDDYETAEQYDQRQLATWRAVAATRPLIVVSHNIEVSRENSEYDPETQVLTIRSPYYADCFGQSAWQCLALGSSNQNSDVARYLTIGGLDVDLYSPLRMAPNTARRLREGRSREEITLFIVTAIIPPYSSRTRERLRTRDFFPVRGYCAHFYWDD